MNNKSFARLSISVVVVTSLMMTLAVLLVRAQQQHEMHGSMTPQQMEEMHKRGNKAMGFDQHKTTHHFLLASDGGSIQVEANAATDTASRDQIRQHLRHIATRFKEGDFEVPMLVHAKNPPGTEVMQRLKGDISYKFKELDKGGSIRITTSDSEALQAVHDFLRFQIKEHMTGDSLESPK